MMFFGFLRLEPAAGAAQETAGMAANPAAPIPKRLRRENFTLHTLPNEEAGLGSWGIPLPASGTPNKRWESCPLQRMLAAHKINLVMNDLGSILFYEGQVEAVAVVEP